MAKRQKVLNSARHRPTIGVFLEYITTYDLALWSGIAEVAQKQNVNLISFMGRCLRDPEGFVAQNNVIYSLASPQNVDGLIFFSAAMMSGKKHRMFFWLH
jgi:hypothetical protein